MAYSDQERLIGDHVKPQLKKNFKNSILYPTRFLGLNSECKDQIALEERFTTHKFVPLENKKLGFEVTQMGQKHSFTIEQVLAFYLTRMGLFYQKAGIKARDIVLSVPSYFSNVERQAMLDAAEIAGMKCLRVINESTAIALNYGFFRKRDLDAEKARNVVFVDVGNSKTTITVAAFLPGKTTIVCHNSDRNLGARDFDYALFEKLGGEFNEKYGADPRKNIRCRIRMLEAIEKARKILSSDTQSNINIDFLLEEEDLVRSLKRDEFEELIAPYLLRFTNVLRETLNLSGKYKA